MSALIITTNCSGLSTLSGNGPELVRRHVRVDICQNPIATGSSRDIRDPPSGTTAALLTKTLRETRREVGKIRSMRPEIGCAKVKESLDTMNITDFVSFETDFSQYQYNQITAMYIKVTQSVMLLRIPRKQSAENCCVSTGNLYSRLRNRTLAKWFRINRDLGLIIERSHCHLRINVNPVMYEPSCETLNRYVYVALRHSEQVYNESADLLSKWTRDT